MISESCCESPTANRKHECSTQEGDLVSWEGRNWISGLCAMREAAEVSTRT